MIAKRCGLTTSTAALILATLDQLTYVARQSDKTYRLGAGVLRLLAGVQSQFPFLGAANDELDRLSDRLQCGCSIARIGATDQEVILTMGDIPSELGIKPGVRMTSEPPHGLLVMAWKSHAEIENWLASTPEPLSTGDIDRLHHLLADIRKVGFAVYGLNDDVHQLVGRLNELLSGLQNSSSAAMAHMQLDQLASVTEVYTAEIIASRRRLRVSHVISPIFGPEGQPRYLISLHLMRNSVSAEELDNFINELLQSAKLLTSQIGGQWFE